MRLRKSIPFDLCPEIGETLYPEHHADINKTTCQAGGFVYAALWQEDRCALFCVQPVPLAELLQLKGQLGAAHDELGENREDGIRDDRGGAVLHFEGNADPLILDAHGIECAGA